MNALEFSQLKALCKPHTIHRTMTNSDGRIEVAVASGVVLWAVELDAKDQFMRTAPEHPFTQGIIRKLPRPYCG